MRRIRWGAGGLALALAACAGAGSDGAGAELLQGRGQVAPPTARDEVRLSPVPVLLLPAPWSEHATLMVGDHYYAVHARSGELTIVLQGTDVVHYPGDGSEGPQRAHGVRGGRPALVLVNDGIRSVTWEEDATTYALEVECYRPLTDERCTGDRFVLELADSLVEAAR